MNNISFENENISYAVPSWNDLDLLAFKVSKKIQQDNQQFDRIVTLAKGGWPMTRSLVDYLQISKVASIGVQFYKKGVDQRFEQPNIYQDIPISVRGESVLLFDDVADTGTSLEFTINYLKTRGVKSVKTAALFYKPHSKIRPDYFGAKTSSWIIFPYDLVEMIKTLGQKWLDQDIKKEKILNRFNQLNFDQDIVQYYFNRLLTA